MLIKVISQIINGIGTTINIIGINFKKKDKTLIFFAIGNTCNSVALGLLEAYAGMIIEILFVMQSIINYFWEKKHDKYPLWLVFLYVLVPSIILIFNFNSLWDIFPLLAGILFPLVLIYKNFILRLINFFSVVVWIPYNFYFGQYVGAISCIIFAIINIMVIIRFDILKK